MKKKLVQSFEGVALPKNKMNVENFKSVQPIWDLFIVKCSYHSQIEHLKNILPKIYSLGHILVI